MVNIVKV